MKTVLHINDKPIVVVYNEFDQEVNVEELTSIDYGNIYGEAVSISCLLAKIGMMKAEAEKYLAERKLEHEIYEARKRKSYRKFAAENGGKILTEQGDYIKMTENSLDELIVTDLQYQRNKKAVIDAKKQYEYMDAIFWAASSKDKKLNNIVKAVTPEEFYEELVEGAINGMIIKKGKIEYS